MVKIKVSKNNPVGISVNENENETNMTVEKAKVINGGGVTEEVDPTVPEWAKQPEKPTYHISEIEGADEIAQEVDSTLTVEGAAADAKAVGDALQATYKRLNSNTTLGFYCIEDVTIVTNGVSKTYPANSNVEVGFSEGDTFEIITTSDNSIMALTAFPGALGTYYPWLEGVKQFSNILFDMNNVEFYSKWSQGNQGAYQVQFAQYVNCIFWSDNSYVSDVSKRTNYTLYYTSQLPLCYSNIPDNTFKAFFLAFGVNNDPNWGNKAYRESFAKATWATQAFSYYGARTIGVFGHDDPDFNITLPKDCRGLMYASTAIENAGTFDAINTTNFGAKSGSWRDAFGYCSSLRNLYIKNLKVNLNVSWSPLEYDSISFIISMAANTNKITISVSPYTYNLLGTADFELAASKNIVIEMLTTNWVEDKRLGSIANKADKTYVDEIAGSIPTDAHINELINDALENIEIPEASGGVQSDWNQNNPEAADYIKNRPFHTGEMTYVEVVHEPLIEEDGWYWINWSLELKAGNTYKVLFDGVEYMCEAYVGYDESNVYIGNGHMQDESFVASDAPFFITYWRGEGCTFYAKELGNHEIVISQVEPEIHKIDKKYLPNSAGEGVAGKLYTIYDEETWQEVEFMAGVGAEIFNNLEENIAIGAYSHAEGYCTESHGENAHAEGSYSVAKGDNSHAENSSSAIGYGSHSEGGSRANGYYSHAESNSSANGDYSHAENSATANGHESHAEGRSTAEGEYSHSEGSSAAEGEYSHSEGSSTAEGEYSHAEGKSTAKGSCSHSEGNTYASGNYSHSEGSNTSAGGAYSHCEGYYTVANSDSQHAQGKFNIEDTASAHIVGNGISTGKRSNAHTLDWSGNAWFAGDVYVGSTSGKNKDEGSLKLATEAFVAQAIADAIAALPRYNGEVG